MKRFAIQCAVAALLVAGTATAGPSTLQQQIKALEGIDLRATPKHQVLAKTEALMALASKDRTLPLADLYTIRRIEASTWFFAGNAAKALELMNAIISDLGKTSERDSALMQEMRANRAALLGQMGRTAEALSELQSNRAWFAEHKGKQSEEYITSTAEVAALLNATGDPVAAESAAAEAVALARSNKLADSTVTRLWINWATLLTGSGRTADGIRELQSVSRYSEEKLGTEHPFTVGALRNLATELNNAGRFTEAQGILQRTLEITRKTEGEKSPSLTFTLNSLGAAALGSKGPAAAVPFYEMAVQHVKNYPYTAAPHLYGEVALNLAMAYEGMGRTSDTMALRREVLDSVRKSLGEQHATYARASSDLGASLLAAGDAEAALPLLQTASAINEKVQKPRAKLRIQTQVLEGAARVQTGDATGYAIAKAAMQTARDAVLEDLTTPTQTLRNAAQFAGAFTEFAKLALLSGHDDDAFEALQLAQLSDLDHAGAALMARTTAGNESLAARLRSLQDQNAALGKLRSERSALLAASKLTEVAALDTQAERMEREIAGASAAINAEFPQYGQLIRPAPMSLRELQSRLHASESLLIVHAGTASNISMLVGKKRVDHAIGAIGRSTVDQWVARMRGSIQSALERDDFTAPFDAAAAYGIFQAVLPPALDKIAARADTLHVQAGGSLASIPFAALLTRKPATDTLGAVALRQAPWLIKRQAVLTPASLALIGNERPARDGMRFAGIGAPALQGKTPFALALRGVGQGGAADIEVADLPPLPGAQQELQNLSAAFGSEHSLLLTGADATRSRLLQIDLRPYDVLAFATHGLVSGELRGLTEPGLVMTPVSSQADSGVLTASDVATLRLNADWVILSACNTAAGDSTGAPMYSGLARAFIYAGARSLLLSQWPVRDDIASRLSLQTVQAARRGTNRAQALRASQLKLISDPSVPGGANPAAWAPFVLIGQ